jgi:hypothetical protein
VNINWKVASAFATGAVLASGIVYLAVKPHQLARQDVAQRIAPKQAVVARAEPVLSAPVVETKARPPASQPVREKPSPMPPARHKKPNVVAKYEPPPQVVQPPEPPQPAAPVDSPAPETPETAAAIPPAPPPVTPPAAEPPPAAPAPSAPPVENVSLPPSDSGGRVPHVVTLEAGTLLPVRIGETISSARNQPGDSFLATLIQPLVIDGFIIAERGARVEGKVVDAAQPGRVKGASHLEIAIVRLATSDGQNIRIRTEPYTKEASSSSGTDAAKVGVGAAIGAVIGAIAGGGKGAAIGAGVGGAAGVGDVLLTHGKTAEIPVETRISFRVQDSVTITERLD